MSRLRVLGVGSPFGDDRVGWEVADALVARVGDAGPDDTVPAMDVLRLDRPGPSLLNHLRGAERVVIVDALCDGGPAGTLEVLASAELHAPCRVLSGHELGVAGALALLDALGEAPASLHVVAVRIADTGGEGLSDAVAAAVPLGVERVLDIARAH